MKRDILNLNFLYAVNEKIPNRKTLVNHLVKILQIEKEAVYRRLRSEVPFTFAEVSTISEDLGISLDKIIGISTDESHLFRLILNDFEVPLREDLLRMNNYIGFLEIVKWDPNSELNETGNTLPFPMFYKFENINRYYTFKWTFQYKNYSQPKKFKEIVLSSELKETQHKHQELLTCIRHTNLVLNRSVFANLVQDIQYFGSIHLLTNTEIKAIKKDLLQLIDYIEKLAIRGIYEETGNNISIYISQIDVDTNYSCLETRDFGLSMIRTFTLNAVTTMDSLAFTDIKEWINSLKRISTLISISGEKDRYEYINEQKKIINSL